MNSREASRLAIIGRNWLVDNENKFCIIWWLVVTMVETLKRYFAKREDIAFAFLYGSYAKGNATKLSDIDIAIYFYPRRRHPVEYEEVVFYDTENEIGRDLERFLKKEVELLILNRVPATVAAAAIRGIPLAINDWGLYLDFIEVITDEAEEFTEFVIDDYQKRREVAK